MLPANLRQTYLQQPVPQNCVSPLERAEQKHEPGPVIYRLTGRQFVPIVGTAPYNPALMDWFRRDEYMPLPTVNLTYLQAGSVSPLL